MLNPGLMLRMGITKKDEIRLSYNYIPQSLLIIREYSPYDLTNAAIGIKHRLFFENGGLPESSVLFNVLAPINNQSVQFHKFIGYELGFQFMHNFRNDVSLNYNFNSVLNPGNTLFMGNYSVCLNLNILKNAGFFVENFAYFDLLTHNTEWGYDAGFVINPGNKNQIDISAVMNRIQNETLFTFLAGYSHALNFQNKKGCRSI